MDRYEIASLVFIVAGTVLVIGGVWAMSGPALASVVGGLMVIYVGGKIPMDG